MSPTTRSSTPPTLDNRDMWRLDRVRERYHRYCDHFNSKHEELKVHPYDIERGWTSGILDPLIERMKSGDLAAAQIGIEMMEEDRGLAFGSIIKSKIPRALAKCDLTEKHKERLRKRTVEMLLRPFLPKEFRQYAWLARRLGLADWEKKLRKADLRNPWVRWYVLYLTTANPPHQPNLARYFGGA